jgi:hypothetical protein
MASLDPTSFAPALKQLYPNGLAEILYPKCPLFGWLPKKKDFYGKYASITPFYAGTAGAIEFQDAMSEKTNVQTVEFLVTRAKDYAIASVDAEVLMASANDKGAIAKALDTQIRGAMYTFSRSIAYQLYGNGGGARARGDGSWTITGNVITVSDRRALVHFEKGMKLKFATTDGTSGSVKDGEVTVHSVQRNASTITTVEANINAVIVGGVANNDYIFRKGDFGQTLMGLAGWLPTTAPTGGDSHFGVDRSVDELRLAGIRHVNTSSIMEEAVFDACAEASINGASPDTLFMNPLRFSELLKSLHAKTWIDVQTDIPGIGYKAISFPTANGNLKVIPDPNCPYAYGYMLDRETIEFKSLGDTPHFATDDGSKYMRETSSDGVEFRIRGFHNMLIDKPGHNLVITW